MASGIDRMIIALLRGNDGEIDGIQHLAVEELNTANVHHVRQRLTKLEAEGLVRVRRQRPGRGRKARIKLTAAGKDIDSDA